MDDHTKIVAQLDFLCNLRRQCQGGSWKQSARQIGDWLKRPADYNSEETAREAVRGHFYHMLDTDDYFFASALAWDRGMFEQRPRHMKRVFEVLHEKDLLILIGASSLSKSYGGTAWLALDWLRDPADTGIKFGSTDSANLRGNLWANLRAFCQRSLFHPDILINESKTNLLLRVAGARPETGINSVFFSKTETSQGKVKGVHPKRFREEEHPLWGYSTRMRIFLDECQNLFAGVKKDFGSPKSTLNPETHLMKIILTANPEDVQKWIVQLAEPPCGWCEEVTETMWEWQGKEGFYVLRLDGAKFENVIERKEIFPGWLTYEGYTSNLANGVEPTADFYIFGRGVPPPGQKSKVVVPTEWFDTAIGEPIFTGPVKPIGGADAGYVRDKGCLALGRWGMATGWRDSKGEEHLFPSRTVAGQNEMRHCGVLDQLIHLRGKDPVAIVNEIKAFCDWCGVKADFLCMDNTGNGYGIWSTATSKQTNWGNVYGMNWKAAPTKNKILAEDKNGADEQTSNMISEIMWTLRLYMQPTIRAFFINPTCDHRDKLRLQMTSRQYRYGPGNRVLVESKDDYKKRGHESPDEFDSTAMMGLMPRVQGLVLPANVDENPGASNSPGAMHENRTAAVEPGLTGSTWDDDQLQYPGGDEVVDTLKLSS